MNTLGTFGSCGLTRYAKHYARGFSISCIDIMGCSKDLLLSIHNTAWGNVFSCMNIRLTLSEVNSTWASNNSSNSQAHKGRVKESSYNCSQDIRLPPGIRNYEFSAPFFKFQSDSDATSFHWALFPLTVPSTFQNPILLSYFSKNSVGSCVTSHCWQGS